MMKGRPNSSKASAMVGARSESEDPRRRCTMVEGACGTTHPGMHAVQSGEEEALMDLAIKSGALHTDGGWRRRPQIWRTVWAVDLGMAGGCFAGSMGDGRGSCTRQARTQEWG